MTRFSTFASIAALIAILLFVGTLDYRAEVERENVALKATIEKMRADTKTRCGEWLRERYGSKK